MRNQDKLNITMVLITFIIIGSLTSLFVIHTSDLVCSNWFFSNGCCDCETIGCGLTCLSVTPYLVVQLLLTVIICMIIVIIANKSLDKAEEPE